MSDEEIPKIILKKVETNGATYYVMRIFLNYNEGLKRRPTFIYSAWEPRQENIKYLNTTIVNNMHLGQLGTQDTDNVAEPINYKKNKEQAYAIIFLASKEAKEKGFIHNCFVLVEKT